MSGFSWGSPKENWCKLPLVLIDALPQIETLAEMKIILYILRHTWGYQNDTGAVDQYKRLTMDDFVNGRRDKQGVQLDNGVGMSPVSIRDGINRAEAHGFIQVIADNRDMARQKRFYALAGANVQPLLNKLHSGETMQKMLISDDQKLTPRGLTFDDQKLTPDDQKLTPRGSETDHRTKIDTNKIDTNKKESSSAAPVGGSPTLAIEADIKLVSDTLQNVGVGLSSYIVDQYADLITDYGIHATVAGILAAADNHKQHQLKYVSACIRNAAQGGNRKDAPHATNRATNHRNPTTRVAPKSNQHMQLIDPDDTGLY